MRRQNQTPYGVKQTVVRRITQTDSLNCRVVFAASRTTFSQDDQTVLLLFRSPTLGKHRRPRVAARSA